jgi:YfiH family protein
LISAQSPTEQTIDLAPHVERSPLLLTQRWLTHGITRRVPGLGLADGNVGYTAPRDEADAWAMRQRWAYAIGVSPASLVRVRQVHGNVVHVATEADLARGAAPDATDAPIADSVITNEPNLALTTLHADCLAMLLADPVTRSVAAVHAGWRSTVADIAGETIRAMIDAFGTEPSDVIAWVGPSIGCERYEVGNEVAAAWLALDLASDDILHPAGEKWQFDLKLANAALLQRAGVRETNVEISDICTATDTDNWFSHRAQGPLTGRFAAVISVKGDASP